MSKESERVKEYKYRLRDALKFLFGNECFFCDAVDELQFMHKMPDEMNGMGRGSYKRYVYIKNHPERFLLSCKECHIEFDRTGIPPII